MSQPNDKKDPENDKDPKESENNEFEFYFQFTKPLVLYLPTPEDRAVAAAWVQKLEAEPETEEEKQLRLDYLKLLLFVLQRGRLSGIFRKQPPAGPLQPFPPGFSMSDMGNLMIDQDDAQSFGGGDARSVPYNVEISNDLREFVAAQEIPNFGVQMYYAWSSDEPIHKWTLFDEEKFPQHILDKIKLLKEIKSDDKTGSLSEIYGQKKSCAAPLAEKEKARVKSPQEIEKTQGRSYQTYLGLVGRMGGGFKDTYDDDPEKFCKQDQRKTKSQKNVSPSKNFRNGQNCYPGPAGNPPTEEEYNAYVSGANGNFLNCRCPPPYHLPECEANRAAVPNQGQMMQNLNRSPSPRPGPSWCTPVSKGFTGRPGTTFTTQSERMPIPEETPRSYRRSIPPADKNFVPNRNDRTQILENSGKPPQSPNESPTCSGGTGVCTCPCPRSAPADTSGRPSPPMNSSGRSSGHKSRSSQRSNPPPAPPPSPQLPVTRTYDPPTSLRYPGTCSPESEAQDNACADEEEYFSGEDPARPAWGIPEIDPNSPPYFGFPSGPSSGGQTSGCDTCSPNVSPLAYATQSEAAQQCYRGSNGMQQQEVGSPEYFADIEDCPSEPYGAECYSSSSRSSPRVNFYRRGPGALPKPIGYAAESESSCHPSSRSGGSGGKDSFPPRELGRPLQAKVAPSSPGIFSPKNHAGRLSNMAAVLENIKQKTEAHREKCVPSGSSSRRAEGASRRSTFVKSPSGFFVPNISPTAGRTPYPDANCLKNLPVPQKSPNCCLQVPQMSPYQDDISPQRGYSSNSNSVGIAVSTPIPRRAVRNFKSGSGSQEVRSGVPRNICIEEEEYVCIPAPDCAEERPSPVTQVECLEVCEEEPEIQEVQCSPQWFPTSARSRSPRPLVQQQEVLPQVPVRRCRLITSTPKRQSFGLCESTIPCYHSENEVCAEPESYWHPMMSNNAICTPQENYAKYACPSSPQFQTMPECCPNATFTSGTKEKSWRESQGACEEIPQEDQCNQMYNF